MANKFHGIILLGAPGSGKGTQAKLLADELHIPHISSGELLRENVKNGTSLGIIAKQYLDKGELVPNDVTVNMIRERLSDDDCKEGFILDGFPRTIAQADALNVVLKDLNKCICIVPFMRVNEKMLMARLAHRLTCGKCGSTYNIASLSPGDICEKPSCGGVLYRRSDDDPVTQQRRIHVYEEQTAPLVSYYAERGLLVRLSGEHTIDYVFQRLLTEIENAPDCMTK